MLVFDAHTAHEIVGIDGDAFGIGRLVGDRLVAHAPAPSPITASSSKVISGMRHTWRLAFQLDFVRNCFRSAEPKCFWLCPRLLAALSIPYTKKVTTLMTRRKTTSILIYSGIGIF